MAELSFKHKVFKALYGMGLKNFGPELLTEMERGSPEWLALADGLLDGSDLESRKLVIRQLTGKGVLEKSKQRKRLVDLLLAFLSRGRADEKRSVIKFVSENLKLFPVDDDQFKAKILALQRDKDNTLNQAASALMPRLGLNMDDRDMYRR